VKRPVAWLLGGLAVAGAYAWGRLRRPYAEPPASAHREPPPEEGPDPRAEALRRRLEESRTLVAEREAFEEGETTVDRAEAPPEERRRELHERARAAADEMRAPTD
jgi:hypothetical protein